MGEREIIFENGIPAHIVRWLSFADIIGFIVGKNKLVDVPYYGHSGTYIFRLLLIGLTTNDGIRRNIIKKYGIEPNIISDMDMLKQNEI